MRQSGNKKAAALFGNSDKYKTILCLGTNECVRPIIIDGGPFLDHISLYNYFITVLGLLG